MPLPESLRLVLFWVAVLAFAVAQAALVAGHLRRRSPVEDAVGGARSTRGAELAMLLAPGAFLAFLFALVWRDVSTGAG